MCFNALHASTFLLWDWWVEESGKDLLSGDYKWVLRALSSRSGVLKTNLDLLHSSFKEDWNLKLAHESVFIKEKSQHLPNSLRLFRTFKIYSQQLLGWTMCLQFLTALKVIIQLCICDELGSVFVCSYFGLWFCFCR